jgi:hypothetical protein
MSDFLANLASRVVAPQAGLRPRRPSRFEPDGGPSLPVGLGPGTVADMGPPVEERREPAAAPAPRLPRAARLWPRLGDEPPAPEWPRRTAESGPDPAGSSPDRRAARDGRAARGPGDLDPVPEGRGEPPPSHGRRSEVVRPLTESLAEPPSHRPDVAVARPAPAEDGDRGPARPIPAEPASPPAEGRSTGPAERGEARPGAPFAGPTAAPPPSNPPTPHPPTVVTVREVRPAPPDRQATRERPVSPGRPHPGERVHEAGEAPVVHVTIGRIEVRAVRPALEERPGRRPPVMTLEDYLRRRSEGGTA